MRVKLKVAIYVEDPKVKVMSKFKVPGGYVVKSVDVNE